MQKLATRYWKAEKEQERDSTYEWVTQGNIFDIKNIKKKPNN